MTGDWLEIVGFTHTCRYTRARKEPTARRLNLASRTHKPGSNSVPNTQPRPKFRAFTICSPGHFALSNFHNVSVEPSSAWPKEHNRKGIRSPLTEYPSCCLTGASVSSGRRIVHALKYCVATDVYIGHDDRLAGPSIQRSPSTQASRLHGDRRRVLTLGVGVNAGAFGIINSLVIWPLAGSMRRVRSSACSARTVPPRATIAPSPLRALAMCETRADRSCVLPVTLSLSPAAPPLVFTHGRGRRFGASVKELGTADRCTRVCVDADQGSFS